MSRGYAAFEKFSNFKCVCTKRCAIECLCPADILCGPNLVSRTGDEGWTQWFDKAPNCSLIGCHKRVLVHSINRTVFIEVEIRQVVCNNSPAELTGPEIDAANTIGRYSSIVLSCNAQCVEGCLCQLLSILCKPMRHCICCRYWWW